MIKRCLLFVVICALLLQAEGISPEAMKVIKKCMEETNVDPINLMKIKTGVFANDPTLKAHLLCVSKNFEIQTGKGDINKEVLKAKLQKVLNNSEQAEKIVKKCSVAKGTPEETAFEVAKCIYANLPANIKNAS